MKATKKTEGTLSTLDKTFNQGQEVEVTDVEFKYLQKTFGDIFDFSGKTEEPKDKPKEEPKAKATK